MRISGQSLFVITEEEPGSDYLFFSICALTTSIRRPFWFSLHRKWLKGHTLRK